MLKIISRSNKSFVVQDTHGDFSPWEDEDDDDEWEFDDEDDEEWDDDDDYEEGFEFGDPDTTIYEVECACGEVINFDEETLEAGSIVCPKCGETLEFSVEEDDDAPLPF